MFEPSAVTAGPSGLSDWPRPFVFRADHLDGRTIDPGSGFHFDLNLFDMQGPAIAYLVLTFGELAREGLGPGRKRADLSEVWSVENNGNAAVRIYDGLSFLLREAPAAMELDLSPLPERVKRVRVRFVTPTELKSGQKLAERPDGRISLHRRICGRGGV